MHSIHILFVIWVVHAALNQLFCCSTATVVVKCWDHLTAKPLKSKKSTNLDEALITFHRVGQIDNATQVVDYDRRASIIRCESSSSSSSSVSETVELLDNDEKYIVRQLLHDERVPTYLRGRDGSASTGVDRVVRIQTAITIITTFFMIGLGKVPLESIAVTSLKVDVLRVDSKRIYRGLLFSWLFWGVLYGIWSFFMKSRPLSQIYNGSCRSCWRSIAYALDMFVILAMQTMSLPGKKQVWFVCLMITVKSFIHAQRNSSPKHFWTLILVVEFLAKLSLLQILLEVSADNSINLISSMLTLLWLVWVITNPIPTPCEVKEKTSSVADAVFVSSVR
jgi:hypothetical protein